MTKLQFLDAMNFKFFFLGIIFLFFYLYLFINNNYKEDYFIKVTQRIAFFFMICSIICLSLIHCA